MVGVRREERVCACACLHCCAGLGEGKQRKRWGSKPASHCALSHAGVLVRVRLRERKARVRNNREIAERFAAMHNAMKAPNG